jgi:hypothetical protein
MQIIQPVEHYFVVSFNTFCGGGFGACCEDGAHGGAVFLLYVDIVQEVGWTLSDGHGINPVPATLAGVFPLPLREVARTNRTA